MPTKLPSNNAIAAILDRIADLLEAQDQNPFRIGSYRKAAQSIRGSNKPVAKLLQSQGVNSLKTIGGVGEKLSGLISEFIESGRVELLDDLEAGASADAASKDTQKAKPKKGRVAKVDNDLQVDVILGVDEEYRGKAKEGKLRMIAPKKLNPEGKAWLPIFNTERKGWKFTVMFSNTARAHELDKTHDWVVVYYERGGGENQCTVVTEQRGVMKGKRVIRGREKECQEMYEAK